MSQENQKILYEHFLNLVETGTEEQKKMATEQAEVIDKLYNFSGKQKKEKNVLEKVAEEKSNKKKE